jgi:hypothetical protein
MRRTNLTKKNKRHSRRRSNKRRTNKRRSRRVRQVGGADYSEQDMTLFKQHIVLNILNGSKKAKLLDKLSSMPYDPNYVYQFHIANAKKTPFLQGKDRIDAFNRYGDNWWGE